MKRNVTYIFGAGASAYALPIVKFFNLRLNYFLEHLKFINHTKDLFSDFIPLVEKILTESENHSTIDTVAKKYFHQNDITSLEQLKQVLTVFFVYEQTIKQLFGNFMDDFTKGYLDENEKKLFFKLKKGTIDYRYDSFIASLLQSKQGEFNFPVEVNIITWNYDCQFELAYQRFHNVNFEDTQYLLNVFPKNTARLNKEDVDKLNGNNFKILHLNGQAHTFYKDQKGTKFSLFERKNNIQEILETAIKFSQHSSITFTWEGNSTSAIQDAEMKDVIKAARDVLEKTSILVVIGYSFPFFNREIDRELFLNRNVEKVYIQDTNSKNLKDLFSTVFEIKDNKIIEYPNIVDQFLLPPELDADYKPPLTLEQVKGAFR